jgi:hypothetical protein
MATITREIGTTIVEDSMKGETIDQCRTPKKGTDSTIEETTTTTTTAIFMALTAIITTMMDFETDETIMALL